MKKTFTRKLTRAGSHSYTVNIPKEVVQTLKWREKQKVDIIFDSKKASLVVRDWKK